MADTFMAAYERAEEKNDLEHGWFQDKKEERARKKRNQRIAGIATIGAGLAAAGGLSAYAKYKGGAEQRDLNAMKKTAEALRSEKTTPNPENSERVDKTLRNLVDRSRGEKPSRIVRLSDVTKKKGQ